MASQGPNPHVTFGAALLATAVVALLPARFRVDWTQEIARLAQIPVRPFAHGGNALAGWLRPAPSPVDGVDPSVRAVVDQLMLERDLAHRRYLAERSQVLELTEQLQELQRLPPELLEGGRVLRVAPITRRLGDSKLDPVEVSLPRGADDERLAPHAVAVHRGVHLLGKTVGTPTGTTLEVLPIGAATDEWLAARIVPDGAAFDDGLPIAVKASGDGRFVGQVDRAVPVPEGATVYLHDESWPATARGLTMGRVESVDVDDNEPLRHRVIVRPDFTTADVASVTLIFESMGRVVDAADSEGGRP